MTLVARDRAAELDRLDRAERLGECPGYAVQVVQRLDEVEAQGGPDRPVESCEAAIAGAHEEAVDGSAWASVAFHRADDDIDPAAWDEASILLEEAMACFARAEHLLRGAADLVALSR